MGVIGASGPCLDRIVVDHSLLDRVGYNHACEYKPIARGDVDRVKAVSHSKKLLGFAKL